MSSPQRFTGATVLLVASVAVSVGLWLVVARSRGSAPENVVPVESAPSAARPSAKLPREPDARGAREALPSVAKEAKTSDAEDSDPPTPERPGPGQALLRVEVVALETGKLLAGARLRLTSDAEDHEWISSRQTDLSRGVENDDVTSNSEGRGEFVVQTNFAYTLDGLGENGLAADSELSLTPFHEGEERDVRLALPTAWTRDWYGRVVDGETGSPLVGVEVVALAPHSSEVLGNLVEFGRARTDGDGRASLRLPSWESAEIRCEVAGYFWRGFWAKEEALDPEHADELRMNRTGSLDVTVLGADGKPAPGLDVRMRLRASFLLESIVDDVLEWRATTGASGHCSFAGLPPIETLPLCILRGERVLLWPFGPGATHGLELAPGEHRVLEARLEGGIRLTVRVLDAAGKPLAGVPLYLAQEPAYLASSIRTRPGATLLADPSFMSTGSACAAVQTDEEGRFSVEQVPAGVWAIGPNTVEAEDFPSVLLFFCIDASATEKEVELRLDRGLSIRGTVFDPEGKPARGSFVQCFGPATGTNLNDYSARDGSFSFRPLVQGSYRLSAGGGGDEAPTVVGAEDVEAPAGARDVVLHQRWGAVLHGRVVNARGEPVEASVELVGFPYSHIEEDAFRFANVPPGNYDLVAMTDDEIGLLTAIPVRPRSVIEDLEVHLEPGVRLTVHLSGVEDNVRIEVIGREVVIASLFQQQDFSGEQIVPPGNVRVAFSHWVDGHWDVVHEERRTAVLGEALTVDYRDTP